MKLTFISSTSNAVSQYRIRHPMRALELLGHECSFLMLDNKPQKVANTEFASDLVILGRQTQTEIFELAETLPKPMQPRFVYEIDDNPWEWHPWDETHAKLGAVYGKRVREVLDRCHGVTCSTPTLAARIRREFPDKPIWVIPNAIDFNIRNWQARENRAEYDLEDKLVLGWTGSIHHQRDGGAMLQALPVIFDAYPETVFLMQCDPSVYHAWTRTPEMAPYKDRLRFCPPLNFDQHPSIYSLFDINLAPLEITPFNACKSDLRLIEGGAQGVPYVASKIAPYLEFHRMSGEAGGYLASTPGEWVTGISNLLDGERDGRGQTLASYVKATRSLDVVVGQWQAAFQGILNSGEGEGIEARWEVGRNAPCPCGSGLKTKRCCDRAYASG